MVTCIITGATGDIGRQLTADAANLGYHVAGVYESNSNNLDVTKKHIGKGSTSRVSLYQKDLRSPDNCKEVVEDIRSDMGQVDILINAIGSLSDKKLINKSDDEIIDNITVNLLAPVYMTKYCLPDIKKSNQGRIVNISSIVAVNGNSGQTIYSASKSGLIGFTKSVAAELSDVNSTANVVSPGFVDSEMVESIPDIMKSNIKNKLSDGKFIPPNAISNTIMYICSNESSHINGSNIILDDGYLVGTT